MNRRNSITAAICAAVMFCASGVPASAGALPLQAPALQETYGAAQAPHWTKINGRYYYYGETGSPLKNWQWVNGSWYFLDSLTGVMKTGWVLEGDTWYYLEASGAMKTGWMQDADGKWYFLHKGSGKMITGWILVDGIWYYQSPATGAMHTGWLETADGTWYYMESSGAMHMGLLSYKGDTYYLDSSGAMSFGWKNKDGEWYYFENSGKAASGWKTISGENYYFYEDGRMAHDTSIGNVKLDSGGTSTKIVASSTASFTQTSSDDKTGYYIYHSSQVSAAGTVSGKPVVEEPEQQESSSSGQAETEVTVVSVSIDSSSAEGVYQEGDFFNADGYAMILSMSDGTNVRLNSLSADMYTTLDISDTSWSVTGTYQGRTYVKAVPINVQESSAGKNEY